MSGQSQTKGTKRGRSSTRRRLRLGAYPRVSRQGTREDERLRSPDFQTDLMSSRLGADYELVPYPAEIDVSGGKPRRAILDSIIEAIERGELDGIAVAKLDRLARLTPKDRVELIERIEDAGGVIVSASENLDVSTPEGRFARDVFLGVARMELERAMDGFITAKTAAIAAGIAIKTVAPFGTCFTDRHGLAVVEAEAEIVLELFELRLAGWSYGRLADHFTERTGRPIAGMSIRRMLENRTYIGEIRYADLVNAEPWKAENSASPDFRPIVPAELFEAVQALGEERAPGRGVAVGRAKSLLAGIAKCGGCDGPMTRKTTHGGRLVYKCNTVKPHKCRETSTIGLEELEAFVVQELLDELGPAADVEVDVEVELGASVDHAIAEQRLEQAQAALRRYETDVELEIELGAETYAQGRQARLELVERRRGELDRLGERTELDQAHSTLRRELTGDGELDVDELRGLLSVAIDRVVVRRVAGSRLAPASERAEVLFAAPAPPATDEPAAERAVELIEQAAA